MSTVFAKSVRIAQRASARVCGGDLIYGRGEASVLVKDATFGKTEFQVETSDAVRLEHTDRDFMFPAASLILNGAMATPESGDRIAVVGGDVVWEVRPVGNEKPYRTFGPDQFGVDTMVRVHTKKV